MLVFVVYNRRREAHIKYPGPDDDVRENIINYDDEGGGEDDMTAFDITPLQIPIGGTMPELTQMKMPPIMCKYLLIYLPKLFIFHLYTVYTWPHYSLHYLLTFKAIFENQTSLPMMPLKSRLFQVIVTKS